MSELQEVCRLGITDRECRLCFALALWNGRDPILKERLFGLTGPEGNHGEDVKECYYYLDSTPTHFVHAWQSAILQETTNHLKYAPLLTNHTWTYEGAVDDSGKTITLEAEGPNFMSAEELTKFRVAYEFKSADHIAVVSSMLREDGKWIVFMRGNMRRSY